ncbi:MAG: DUF2905 domain-containing protein [Deltaproteobacteria bacterium]|nr:MAG: DUF2905 domain-containing protein [Deltaproteobacteria bacterium]
MSEIGKVLIISGIFIILLGIIFLLGSKIPGLGRLPGDIYIKKDNFTFYFPLTTCIVISIILTLLLLIFRK